jgi:hypothetical protein
MMPRIKDGFRRSAQSSSAAFRADEGVSVSSVVTSSTEFFEEPFSWKQPEQLVKTTSSFSPRTGPCGCRCISRSPSLIASRQAYSRVALLKPNADGRYYGHKKVLKLPH